MVERCFWEAEVARSNRVTPTYIHTTTMNFYSVKYWEENFDALVERVENGETIGIENENGERAVMMPADDELFKIYKDLNNEAS